MELMMTVVVVMAREPILDGPSVFLAGPTHADPSRSWRPTAIQVFQDEADSDVTLLSPESRGGKRAATYGDQVKWEIEARARATVRMFWVPRDMDQMPGMTTNVEFGFDLGHNRTVVLGCPLDCPSPERNRYLIYLANVRGAPVTRTLRDTVVTALSLLKA